MGIAIATKIPNPYISIPLAFASHFFLDRVPHWNPHLTSETKKFGKPTLKTTIIVALDVSTSLAIGIFFALRATDSTQAVIILLASFASVLPDVLEGPYFFLGFRNKLLEKWINLQKSIQVNADFIPGTLTQVVTLLATFYWIIL